jgi:hypothetical protein
MADFASISPCFAVGKIIQQTAEPSVQVIQFGHLEGAEERLRFPSVFPDLAVWALPEQQVPMPRCQVRATLE